MCAFWRQQPLDGATYHGFHQIIALSFIQRIVRQPTGRAVEQGGNGVTGGQQALFTESGAHAKHQQQPAFVLLAQLPDPFLLLFIQAAAVALYQTKMPGHFLVQIQVRADQMVESVAFCRGRLFEASEGGEQLFVELLDQVEQQVLLAGVMVIQRARGEPQARRELTHADLTETLAGKELQHLVPVFGET